MTEIITRQQWGARAPKHRVLMSRSKGMFTHYTAGPRARNRAEGLERMRQTQNFHMGPSRNWSDFAYSFAVDDQGTIYEGRGWGVVGGHTKGHNSTSHAVVALLNAGDHPTDAMLRSILWLHLEHDRRYGSGFHLPHRAAGQTACPGEALTAFMNRSMAGVSPAGPAPAPTPQAPVDLAALRRYFAAVAFHNLTLVRDAIVKPGANAGHVKAVQHALNIVADTRLIVDGVYGPATKDAVTRFQRFMGIGVDGVAGPVTNLHLLNLLAIIRG